MTGYTDTDTDEVTRTQLVGLLRAALEARASRDQYARQYDAIARLLKDYLTAHEDETLFDGENRIEASLQRRSLGESYDTASMPWALIQALHEARLLTVNVAGVRALTDQRLADEVKRFKQPGGETTALLLKKMES